MRNKVQHVALNNIIYKTSKDSEWKNGFCLSEYDNGNHTIFVDLNFAPIKDLYDYRVRTDVCYRGCFEPYQASVEKSDVFGK